MRRRQQPARGASVPRATVQDLVSAVAHSLGNPLASMRALAELALEEERLEEVRALVQDMVTEVDRLDARVQGLLTYTRPLQHHPVPIPLQEILQPTLHHLEPQATQQSVTPHLDVPASLPVLQVDAALLTQACQHLLTNALEAMPQGGTLTVRAAVTAHGGHVRLQIHDTGPGIPAAYLQKVGTPFFTTKPQGLGLGVALARQIVAHYGGTLALTSAEGQGTTATMKLPIGE